MSDPSGPAALARVAHLAASQAYGRLADDALLERFAAGRDESAFAALVERHGPAVLDAALAVLRQAQDAEDVFQATFLVLARKAATIRNRSSVGCWLHRVARQIALRTLRARTRRDRHESATPVRAIPTGDDLTWGEVRGIVHEELARLPESLRGPILLCYLDGLTQDEAADRLGLPKGTLKGRLERGRDALRRRLVRRGLASAGALFPVSLGQAITPPVSPMFVLDTARSAVGFAAGAVVEGPGRAVGLAKGALRAMALTRLKMGLLVLAGIGLAGLSVFISIPSKNPATAAPAAKTPELKPDFEELTIAIKPSGLSPEFPSTIRMRADGTCVYEVSGRPARGNVPAREPGKTTHKLPADRVHRLNELLKETDWLGKAAPKGLPPLHSPEYRVTLSRKGKSASLACEGEPEAYKPLLTFLHGLSSQEYLLHRLESAATSTEARFELDNHVRAELGEPRGKPTFEIDYNRFVPWATGLIRKPDGHPADDVAAAVRLVGLLKLESEREPLAGLASHENSYVREAVAKALGRLGGEKSVAVLRTMVDRTWEASWELIKLGPIAVPAIAEVIRKGTKPEPAGYELLIRAYIDHWSEVTKPIDARVLDAVRKSMAASKEKGSRTEYHEKLLKLAEK